MDDFWRVTISNGFCDFLISLWSRVLFTFASGWNCHLCIQSGDLTGQDSRYGLRIFRAFVHTLGLTVFLSWKTFAKSPLTGGELFNKKCPEDITNYNCCDSVLLFWGFTCVSRSDSDSDPPIKLRRNSLIVRAKGGGAERNFSHCWFLQHRKPTIKFHKDRRIRHSFFIWEKGVSFAPFPNIGSRVPIFGNGAKLTGEGQNSAHLRPPDLRSGPNFG